MEALLFLAVLFFVVGPIVLFFLVIGARTRVETLENSVRQMGEELRRLRTQIGATPAPSPTR